MKNKTNNVTSHIREKITGSGHHHSLPVYGRPPVRHQQRTTITPAAWLPLLLRPPLLLLRGAQRRRPQRPATAATDSMGDMNGNGNTVGENDSMLDNAGNAIGEAGDTVGNIVDDAANGVSDITNDHERYCRQ